MVICSCCGYDTLNERGCYEICYLCDWEDDVPDPQDGYSAPNHRTIKEARENFKKYLTIYGKGEEAIEGKELIKQNKTKLGAKKNIIKSFELLKKTKLDTEKEKLRNIIDSNKKILYKELKSEIKEYHKRIGKLKSYNKFMKKVREGKV